MQLIVDQKQRLAKMRAHTATHLLHAELANFFPYTKQAWSYVDKDITRFDFHVKETISDTQIRDIENNINTWIKQWLPVKTEELSYKDAIALGAKAFFGDKYGDHVRVVSIQNPETHTNISIELCWWTHVKNTADIGGFKIISQEAVAAGIKRITALTWPRIVDYTQEQEEKIKQIAAKLGVQPQQIESKIEKILTAQTNMEHQLISLQHKYLSKTIKEIVEPANKRWIEYCIMLTNDILSTMSFKEVINYIKQELVNKTIIIYKDSWWEYAIISWSDNFSSKDFAQQQNLQGGWSDSVFQGKDQKINDIAKELIG